MTDEAMSPLRRRMIEDMTIRPVIEAQQCCVGTVENFPCDATETAIVLSDRYDPQFDNERRACSRVPDAAQGLLQRS